MAGLALADGVSSQNVVGYTAIDAAQGKFIITAAQLENVGEGTRAINDLVKGVTGVYYDDDNLFKTTAAQVQVPAAVGYNTYFYLEDGWYDDNGNDGYKPGWCDGSGVLIDSEVTPGVAFWLKSVPDAATVTVAGEVSDDSAIAVSCPANFSLRANAFPIEIVLNGDKMATSGAATIYYDDDNLFKTTAAQVQVPAAVGYNTYFYLEDGWYDDNGNDGYKPGWCDGSGVLVDTDVPVAQGFWTKGVGGAFTLTFAK